MIRINKRGQDQNKVWLILGMVLILLIVGFFAFSFFRGAKVSSAGQAVYVPVGHAADCMENEFCFNIDGDYFTTMNVDSDTQFTLSIMANVGPTGQITAANFELQFDESLFGDILFIDDPKWAFETLLIEGNVLEFAAMVEDPSVPLPNVGGEIEIPTFMFTVPAGLTAGDTGSMTLLSGEVIDLTSSTLIDDTQFPKSASFTVVGTTIMSEDCTNGVDDDGDSLVDCYDDSCSVLPICDISITDIEESSVNVSISGPEGYDLETITPGTNYLVDINVEPEENLENHLLIVEITHEDSNEVELLYSQTMPALTIGENETVMFSFQPELGGNYNVTVFIWSDWIATGGEILIPSEEVTYESIIGS